MRCPNCHTEFVFGWRMYLLASFTLNKFKAPCCKAKVKLKSSWSYLALGSALFFLIGFFSATAFIEEFSFAVRAIAVISLLLFIVLDKTYDAKRELVLRGS